MRLGNHKRHVALSAHRWGIVFRFVWSTGAFRCGIKAMWQRKRFSTKRERQASLVLWSRMTRKNGGPGIPHTIQFSVFTS